MPEADLASVTVIVSGSSSAVHLERCLDALRALHYPAELVQVIYVASGLSAGDFSQLRTKHSRLELVELPANASPGQVRNAGLAIARGDLLQFLSPDARIDPDWLLRAAPQLRGNCVAVLGRCDQVYPERSVFHFIADLEGQNLVADLDQLGPNFLISRSGLAAVGAYAAQLSHTQDLDLAQRLLSMRKRIQGLRCRQCFVDAEDQGLWSYLEHGYAQGHLQAELAQVHKQWRPLLRTVIRALLPLQLLAMGLFPLVALLILLWPFRYWSVNQERFDLSFSQSFLFTLHRCLSVYPRLIGALRYVYIKLRMRSNSQPALDATR